MADSGAPDRTEDETGMPVPPEHHEAQDGAAGYPDGALPGVDLHRSPTGDGLVQVAYCHETSVSHSWHASMMQLFAWDKTMGLNVIQSGPQMIWCSGPHGLVEGRNLAMKHFLDNTEHEWLLWVDTDMGFEPNVLDRLLAAADPIDRPVVGALCFALKHAASDGKGGYRVRPLPTLFSWAKTDEGISGFAGRMTYPQDSLVQVAGTGSAFILIHRSVAQGIRDAFGDEWYNLVAYGNGMPISEDLSFCYRVAQIKKPIFVHTGIQITHHKEIWLDAADYDMPATEPHLRKVSSTPVKDPVPADMDPTKWASMNREERRAWKRR